MCSSTCYGLYFIHMVSIFDFAYLFLTNTFVFCVISLSILVRFSSVFYHLKVHVMTRLMVVLTRVHDL